MSLVAALAGRRAMERQRKLVTSHGVAHVNQASIIVDVIAHLQRYALSIGW
jgi:hypothetical protein